MKKIALILAGLMASGASVAATTAVSLNSGQNPVLMTDCNLLANDISVALTANVTGTLSCNDTDNIVGIALCHTKGLTASRSSVVTTDTTGTICTVVAGTEDCVVTVSGAQFPTVTTADGTVQQQFPATTCTQANTATVAGALTE